MTRPSPVAVLLLAAVLGSQSPAQTLTALGPNTPVDMPDASCRFEAGGLGKYGYELGISWTPWEMVSGSGIAQNGSTLTVNNPDAPEGTCVAFLQGESLMKVTMTVAAPTTCRLHFFGAQRQDNGTNHQVVQVKIGGLEVFRQELTDDTYRLYKTKPIRLTANALVEFYGLSSDNTAFVDLVQAETVRDWNTATDWYPAVQPTTSHDVVIPSGYLVAVQGTCDAHTITVNGSLVAGVQDADINTHWLMVAGEGALFEVGTESAPYPAFLQLRLHGDDPDEDVSCAGVHYGSKFLMAMDSGVIEMHGIHKAIAAGSGRQRAWSHLGQVVSGNVITLAETVPWQVNDWIVIAGSNHAADPDNYVDQAEVCKITSVTNTSSGTQLALDRTPTYVHDGTTNNPYSNGQTNWTLERRAEVGLLSHNVRIVGILGSHTEFGGHVMIMRGPCCANWIGGQGRFTSVEFKNMGQTKKLGRYPLHWHMLQDQGAGQYAKYCSIHCSKNRAITIHGTDSVVLEGNVAYKHLGHGIFFEDGGEQDNELYYNLALSTDRPSADDALLPSDHQYVELQNRSPSTYWITNPHNRFVGNVAAGTKGTGFWFTLPEHPLGLSGNTAEPHYSDYFLASGRLTPLTQTLLEFSDNVCHSSGNGIDLNDSINPSNNEVISNVAWAPATTNSQVLQSFTAYGCSIGLYTGGSDGVYEQIRFSNTVLADNRRSVVFAAYNVLEDSVVLANSGAGAFGSSLVPDWVDGYAFYDGAGRVERSRFEGFAVPTTLPLHYSLLGEIGAATRHTCHRFSQISYDTAPFIYLMDHSGLGSDPYGLFDMDNPRQWGYTLFNQDGTLLGGTGRSLVSNNPMVTSSSDVTITPTRAYASSARWALLLIYHPGLEDFRNDHFEDQPQVNLTRRVVGQTPDVTFQNNYKSDRHKQFPVAMDVPPSSGPDTNQYAVTWPTAFPSTWTFQIKMDDMQDLPAGSRTIYEFPALGGTYIADLHVVGASGELQRLSSKAAMLSNGATAWAIDTSESYPQSLWLVFVSQAGVKSESLTVTWIPGPN